jgi:hypothetical protein
MKLEISQLITIGTIVAVLAGFYYTTEHRLNILEEQVEGLKKSINKINRNKKK